jgi:membrane dipeptidase
LEPNLPLVFDVHNDTLLNLHLPNRGEGRSFFERSDLGHIDLPRSREGRFLACYVPNPEDDGWIEESASTFTHDGYEVSDAPRLDPNYARDFANRTQGRIWSAQIPRRTPARRLQREGAGEACPWELDQGSASYLAGVTFRNREAGLA